jgi:hypothetical protein
VAPRETRGAACPQNTLKTAFIQVPKRSQTCQVFGGEVMHFSIFEKLAYRYQ